MDAPESQSPSTCAIGRAPGSLHVPEGAVPSRITVIRYGPDAEERYDDVRPALEAIRARALRVGVVSNFDGRLPGILDGLGLGFDAVVWSSCAGAAKPDARIFTAAAAVLGVSTASLLHVGDDARADVAGARAAGATAMRIDRTGAMPGGITHLTALAPRLARTRR